MKPLQHIWRRIQGHDCYSCQFCEIFRSNGDGQVSRLHAFCRNPESVYHDRPIPTGRWCDAWRQDPGGRKGQPEEMDRLTA